MKVKRKDYQMKKKTAVKASRNIEVKVPVLTLGSQDFEFEVRATSDSKIGTLKVSQGGVVWKGRSQGWRCTIPWETFDTVMKDYYNQKRFTPRT